MNILHKIKNWLIVLIFGVSVYAYSGTQGGSPPNEKPVDIENLLQNKSAKEKAQIKSKEIAKLKIGKYTKNDFQIVVIGEITEIEGGIQFFAKAWNKKKQIGFGKDGTVEIERFRIYNPPVLVDDINGDIVREWEEEDLKTGKLKTKSRKLKYDPTEAIRQSLSHTIGLVGKDGKNIIKGKIGNTTSTFYPNLSGEGHVGSYNATSDWTTAREATTGNNLSTTDTSVIINYLRHNVAGTNWGVLRYFLPFDTSAIDDGDTIDSATFSLYVISIAETGTEVGIGIIAPTSQASISTLENDDYDTVGTLNSPQEIATRPNIFSWNTSAYNDISLNATGLSIVSKTGYTKIGTRSTYDIDNTELGSGLTSKYVTVNFADQTGTANDPKLVVEHSSAAPTFIPRAIIF